MFLLWSTADHIMRSTRQWDLTKTNPVTSLPLAQQIGYTLVMGVFMYAGVDLAFASIGLLLVPVLGFPPNSCPPFYDRNPFAAGSLAELWSSRWHVLCRRIFERLSLPVVWSLRRITRSKKTINFGRCFAVFAISAALHLAPAYAIPTSSTHRRQMLDPGTIKFFLSQPFGVLLEVAVVNPATEGLPKGWRTAVRRVYLWVWIVWTGRWWSDAYVLWGKFQGPAVGPSPAGMVSHVWRSLGTSAAE